MNKAIAILSTALAATFISASVAAADANSEEEDFRSTGKTTTKINAAVAAVRGGDCDRVTELSEYGNKYVDASFQVAMLLAEGVCVDQDLTRALELSVWNCERQGDHDSCNFLGQQLLAEQPTAEDLVIALAYARFGAYANHAPSMLTLAGMHTLRAGPIHDPDAAIYWFSRAADAGLVEPMYGLFTLYAAPGPIHSPDKARQWLEKAAEAGNPSALIALARQYERGDALYERDADKALYWREKYERTGAADADESGSE